MSLLKRFGRETWERWTRSYKEPGNPRHKRSGRHVVRMLKSMTHRKDRLESRRELESQVMDL